MKPYSWIGVCWVLGCGLGHATGIPVFDEGAKLNAIQQLSQMASQLKQMEQQYKAVTGTRNLGQILNNPALRQYLPADWQQMYDKVRAGGYGGLSGSAATIYRQNQVYDACQYLKQPEERTLCEARAVKGAQDKAFALEAYSKASERLDQINALMRKIDTTKDPKAMAELQGRISAEQAMIQNEQARLQLYKMVADAEDRLQRQKAHEMHMKEVKKRDGINFQPLEFSLHQK